MFHIVDSLRLMPDETAHEPCGLDYADSRNCDANEYRDEQQDELDRKDHKRDAGGCGHC
jgi:hypothetical protein